MLTNLYKLRVYIRDFTVTESLKNRINFLEMITNVRGVMIFVKTVRGLCEFFVIHFTISCDFCGVL